MSDLLRRESGDPGAGATDWADDTDLRITKRSQRSVNRKFQHFRFEMASWSAVIVRRYSKTRTKNDPR